MPKGFCGRGGTWRMEATALLIHAELQVVEAAEPLARLVLEEVNERVTPISFDPRALQGVRRVLPHLPVGLIFSGAPSDAAEGVTSAGAYLATLEAARPSVEAVEGCRRAGLKVATWTVSEPEQMPMVSSMSVDGIVTIQTS